MTAATSDAGAHGASGACGEAERLAAILRAQASLFGEPAGLSRRRRTALLEANVSMLEESTALAGDIASISGAALDDARIWQADPAGIARRLHADGEGETTA